MARRRPTAAALLGAAALLAAGCRGTDAPAPAPSAPPASGPRPPVAAPPSDEVERLVVEARALFAEGEPAAALSVVDRALDLAPERVDLLRARADGLVVLAERMIAEGANGLFVVSALEDALAAYDACPDTARTALGRSRALALLGRGARAHAQAQRALELARAAGEEAASPLAPRAAIVGRAAYLAYAEGVDGRAPEGLAVPDFETALAAVSEYCASEREDPEAWNTLANLHLYRSSATGDVADTRRAMQAVRTGLEHLPEDAGLRARLVELAGRVGGAREQAAVTAALAERYSDSAPCRFDAAKALFDLGLTEFPGPGAEADAVAVARGRFERADLWFEQVAAIEARTGLDEGWGRAAMGWRAVARIARGWVDYWAGELGPAERWFLAANDVFPRGIEWSIEGVLQSGVQGLFAISTARVEAGELEEAARLADLLTSLVPTSGDFANNAGFLNRDAAIALELEGRELARAGRDGAARERCARALELMERSAAAYARAVELLPEDARVANDAALVLVYYLHRDLERAEALLARAVDLARAQLGEADLTEARRFELENALGDAYENLGVLELEHRGDPQAARAWFERAVETGPGPRPMITEVWLSRPEFTGAEPTAEHHTVLDWARPGE